MLINRHTSNNNNRLTTLYLLAAVCPALGNVIVTTLFWTAGGWTAFPTINCPGTPKDCNPWMAWMPADPGCKHKCNNYSGTNVKFPVIFGRSTTALLVCSLSVPKGSLVMYCKLLNNLKTTTKNSYVGSDSTVSGNLSNIKALWSPWTSTLTSSDLWLREVHLDARLSWKWHNLGKWSLYLTNRIHYSQDIMVVQSGSDLRQPEKVISRLCRSCCCCKMPFTQACLSTGKWSAWVK